MLSQLLVYNKGLVPTVRKIYPDCGVLSYTCGAFESLQIMDGYIKIMHSKNTFMY